MNLLRFTRNFGFRQAMLLTVGCFVLIALGVTTVTVISRKYSRQGTEQTETLTGEFLPGLVTLARLQGAAHRLRNINYQFALAKDEVGMNAQKQAFQITTVQVTRNVAALKRLARDEPTQRLIAAFAADVLSYREGAEKFQAELGAGEFEKAMVTLDQQIGPAQEKIETQIDALSEQYFQLSSDAGTRTTALLVQSDHFGLLATIVLAGFTLLCLVLSLAATRALLTQVQKRDAERQAAQDTLEKRVEERTAALGASEERIRLIVDTASDAIITADATGTITAWNRQAEKTCGWTQAEALGRNLAETLIAPSHRDAHRQRLEQFFASGDGAALKQRIEINALHQDGHELPVELAISPIHLGTTVLFSVFLHDITERKLSEAALKKSEQRYHSLFENMLEGYAYCQTQFEQDQLRDFTYLEVNGSFERLTGLKDVIGRKISDVIPGIQETNPELFELYGRVALSGKPEKFETHLESLGIWLSITIYSSEREHFVAVFDNITERKRAEAELAEMNSQLLDVSRQAGMAEVATNVLHNVGNVLNSVNVSSTLVGEMMRNSKVSHLGKVVALLDEHAADLGGFVARDPRGKQLGAYLRQVHERLTHEQENALRELGSLQKNIEHIKDIVAMQQSYGKVSGVAEALNITDLVEDSLRMNSGALLRHEVEVVREFHKVPLINVEKHKVLQILVNLIRNAKYACDEGGKADKQMTLRVMNGDGRIKIAVSDNGVGIPPENLTRIFNHGFTTRAEGHGFGLHSGALAAQQLGGSLTVHSDGPGLGATFTIELPCQNP